MNKFAELGYNVSYGLLSADDYGVPQTRDRVIIVGYDTRMNTFFDAPPKAGSPKTLKDAIWDLRDTATPAPSDNSRALDLTIDNHEYMTGGFSSMYMSRNRVRQWDEPSFTIQAMGRHAPMHPQAPKMQKVDVDSFAFVPGSEDLYRRLSVRECARVQTFPDDHLFIYDKVIDGYKMIGNAVPVEFARQIASQILRDLLAYPVRNDLKRVAGEIKTFAEIAALEENEKLVG